jgi:hypothetical protein
MDMFCPALFGCRRPARVYGMRLAFGGGVGLSLSHRRRPPSQRRQGRSLGLTLVMVIEIDRGVAERGKPGHVGGVVLVACTLSGHISWISDPVEGRHRVRLSARYDLSLIPG